MSGFSNFFVLKNIGKMLYNARCVINGNIISLTRGSRNGEGSQYKIKIRCAVRNNLHGNFFLHFQFFYQFRALYLGLDQLVSCWQGRGSCFILRLAGCCLPGALTEHIKLGSLR